MYVQKLPPFARAVLFDRTKCWLIQTFNDSAEVGSNIVSGMNRINSIDEIVWMNNGSERLFLEFIVEALKPWIDLLWSACNVFNVKLLDSDAFLGSGANGRVFKVRREDNTMVALKIITRDLPLLIIESQKMKAAEETGVVATVLEEYKLLDNGNGAGMLIFPIGKPISRESLTESTIMKIFHNLFILHRSGIQHGDPRLPNLIQVDEKILWIDLMYSMFDRESRWEQDATMLSRSILGLSEKNSLSQEISELISHYKLKQNDHSWEALAKQLWAEFSRKFSG
jgi:tRNA A-37 threonylcarbamoyl transferase component Bud32